MPKTTMNVSIADGLKELAQKQAEERHFSTMSDYIAYLIRSDVERATDRQVVEDQICESHPAQRNGSEIHAEMREEIKRAVSEIGLVEN